MSLERFRAQQVVKAVMQSKQAYTDKWYAVVGMGDGATVDVPSRGKFVYVRLNGDDNRLTTAYCSKFNLAYGDGVIVEEFIDRNARYYVVTDWIGAGPAPCSVHWCNVFVVDCCGGGDFTTIQAAIDNLATTTDPGPYTILIMPCTYTEGGTLNIAQDCTLYGLGDATHEDGATGAVVLNCDIVIGTGPAEPTGNEVAMHNIRVADGHHVLMYGAAADMTKFQFVHGYMEHNHATASILADSGAWLSVTILDSYIHNAGAGDAIDLSPANGSDLWIKGSDVGDVDYGANVTLHCGWSGWDSLTGAGARVFLDAPSPDTWLVGNGPGAYFPDVATAHAHASVNNGDTLKIYPGTYDGFTVTKDLTFIGLGDTAGDGSAQGRVVISGLTTPLDIQSECAFQHIVFEDDDVTVNTTDYVAFEHCRNADYNLTCGAYAVNVVLKDSYWYDITFGAATGGNLYIRNCDGGFGIDHGAAHLYVDNSDYSPPIVGTGLRTTTPNEHVEKTATTASPVQVMDWVADSTGAPVAGFGVRHLFSAEGGAGEGQDLTAIDALWDDPTGGSEDSAFEFSVRSAGAALANRFRIEGSGCQVAAGYGLAVDGGVFSDRFPFDTRRTYTADLGGNLYSAVMISKAAPTAAAMNDALYGALIRADTGGTQNLNGIIRGIGGGLLLGGTGNISVSARVIDAGCTITAACTIAEVVGIQIAYGSSAAQTTSNMYGIKIPNASLSGGAAITTQYGIHIASLTAGTNNYGIYVAGASTYALWLDSGIFRWDDSIAAPGTAAAGTVTNRYGGATNFCGDPDIWLRVNIGGATYKIPCYS